ncbi:hypothetical protein NM688_g8300 [Phlebia brevispora]|uniref:Uncharacterized protein n=1 Tax=Phlebia brevispora TaxID=194682 RepID=A0ACC1RSY1_9APHY|nr:hypothetical protein NM688_g8300 [Phlebia brevispora]
MYLIFYSNLFDKSNIRKVEKSLSNATRLDAAPIYFISQHQAPTAERRTFITDTSVIFAAVENFVTVALANEPELLRNEATQRTLRKLTIDYVNFCKECWVYCSRDGLRSEPLQLEADHYRKLYSCLSLFCVLYLPENGLEDAPVGDELMDWLNRLYVEPSTEEADHLSGLDRPWEDESFWSFLSRVILRGLSKVSAFFLGLLSGHPSPHLQQLVEHLTPLLTNHPRLSNFVAERDFAVASRRWKEKVKALRIELDHVPEDSREDGFDNWWERLSDIVGVLEGRGEVLKRLCIELGADWKTVSIAWSIFIDPRLRRQDLPDIVTEVLEEMPPDPTNLEDALHCSLFLGKPTQMLSQSSNLDPWLAAHVADIMEPLELIDRETNDSGLSMRDFYILSYAEYLRSDPGLWRLTVDYMCSCGAVGEEMADQVLTHVPLRLSRLAKGHELSEEESKIRSGDLVGVLKEVNASCFDHRREAARRTVCRVRRQPHISETRSSYSMSSDCGADFPY